MFTDLSPVTAARAFLAAMLAFPAAAQDPNCLFGANDILCRSSRMADDFRNGLEQPPPAPRNADPYCMYGEDDILCQSQRKIEEARRRGPDDPRSMDWGRADDPCLLITECDMNTQFLIHMDWLEG